MRSHAKASSAGSTQGRGSRSGSFVHETDVTRGSFGDVGGSGAPSHRCRVAASSVLAVLLALALFASPALASKDLISEFGTALENNSGQGLRGSFGGDLNNPRDVAVNGSGVGPANPGDVYVADEANNRVERFASNGSFLSAWGKDTIASSINERQTIVLNEVTSGTYTLTVEGSTTEPIQYSTGAGNIRLDLEALPSIGNGNVKVGGQGTAVNPFVVTFQGALGAANQPVLTADTDELTGTVSIFTIVNGTSIIADDTGTGFEVCTVATECQAGTASGENGALSAPQSVAVDPDTGNVYASDRGNRRIDEYDGEGNFIRSYGWDVVESGPDDAGTEYEICKQAEGDACKAGVGGSGVGQYGNGSAENGFGVAVSPADGNAVTGTVYLADSGNRRVDTFNLDGTSPASFGSSTDFGTEQPRSIAVDSRGIVYASDSNNNGDVMRYDSLNADGGGVGFLEPIVPPNNEQQKIAFTGFHTGDNYKLTCPDGTLSEELAYAEKGFNNAPVGREVIENGLEAACGSGSVSVSGDPPNVTVTLQGALAAANQPQMTCAVLSGSGSCSVTTISDGHPGPLLAGSASSATAGLAVNSAGTTLYVLRDPSSGPTVVQQLGPGHEPGLAAAPTAADDTHGAAANFSSVRGFGFNGTNGRLYLSATESFGGLNAAHRVYVLADSSALPNPTSEMLNGSVAAIADRGAIFQGKVDPKGGLVGCKFQYSTDEVHWTDAGYAEGTGDIASFGSTTITHVKATSGAFYVGQQISGEGLGSTGVNTIIAVGAETLTLSKPTSTSGAGIVFSGTPLFPPRCDSLSLNGGSQSVSQEVGGLVPGTHYFVRLLVTRPYFSAFTPVTSSVQSFSTASGPPDVSAALAKSLDEHSVRVSATIDPAHSPTSYVVQYGTTPSLGSSTAPMQIGAGSSPLEVASVVSGLGPATQYYFKLVATNLAGSTASEGLAIATFVSPPSFGSCPNDRFRTGPSARLPDCRAYEQATPTDKYGSDAYGNTNSVQASETGEGITSYTLSGFPGSESVREFGVFVSWFSSGDWLTAGMNPPSSYGDRTNVKDWTPDLRLSFTTDFRLSPSFGTSLVMRDNVSGFSSILIPADVGFGPGSFALGGAFDDDSKAVFQANGEPSVASGPSSSERSVYLYDRQTEELTLIGLLPDSACGVPPCVPEEGSEFPGASEYPGAFQSYIQDGHVVSTGGDVYFIDIGTGQLYVRHEAAGPGAISMKVAASERTDCADHDPCNGTPEPDPAGSFVPTFMGATPDGSAAFFQSRQKLTDNSAATAGVEDLYSFDANAPEGQRLTDLAPGAKAVGVLGYSDGGDYVYFSANADLDGEGPASGGSCSGRTEEDSDGFSGSCSLYLWRADGTGTCATAGGCIDFIVRLNAGSEHRSAGDGFDWAGSGTEPQHMKASRVSADGRILVFRSQLPLTAYNNKPTQEGVCFGVEGRCPEFYHYDAESGQISCLTCDPTGAPPTGKADLKNPELFHAPTSFSVWLGVHPFLSRNLSADGNRFFFQTPDKLVAADVNGDQSCKNGFLESNAETGFGPPCRDVYEWEAPGEGSCTASSGAYSSANGGCVYLLSTGTGAYPSYLADVSESGDTVFIFSRQQLVPADEDSQEDIYAVKVDGGLATQNAARQAPCEGDGCRGASSQPSNTPGAGTAVFEGPGNPKSNTNSTHCPKGKRTVHSKGKVRCVAKHPKNHRKSKHRNKRDANNDRRTSR
ncbi:MAG: hypothetical protein ACRDLL_00590 [Solirubrobacterales bacterium]